MRRTALVLLLLGAAACTQEISHGDPACAFDVTGCIPFELVLDIANGSEVPSASLTASSPTEEWEQQGQLGTGAGIVVPSSEPGRIAPRIEISIAGDADRARLRIVHVVSSGANPELEVVRRLELGPDPQVVRLESGETYVLHVRAVLSEGEAEFFFLTRVP